MFAFRIRCHCLCRLKVYVCVILGVIWGVCANEKLGRMGCSVRMLLSF